MEEKIIEYAPIIVVIVAYCWQYKLFATPSMVNELIDNKLKNYVLKEAHDLAINGIKEDISEIKANNTEIKKEVTTIREQNAQLLNKIMNLV